MCSKYGNVTQLCKAVLLDRLCASGRFGHCSQSNVWRAIMDTDADFEPLLAAAPEDVPETTDPALSKRKRGSGGKDKSDGGTPDSKQGAAKAKAAAKASGRLTKSKCQCMCCGKIFEKSLMSNGRHCPDGKRITDRLYHAAKSQGKVQWLSDQLSTLAT